MTPPTILGVLAALAVAMVVVTSYLLKWAALSKTQVRADVMVFLTAMMTAMLVGAALYFVSPGPATLVEGFWVASVVMSAAVLGLFFEFARETRRGLQPGAGYVPSAVRRPLTYTSTLIALVFSNEFLMGWTFQRAAGGPVWLGGGGPVGLLESVLVSPWFVLPMALEMVLTISLLGSEFPAPALALLATQPVVMLASPPTFADPTWVLATAALGSATMAVALAYVLRRLYRADPLGPASLRYAYRLFGAYGAMAAGLAWWAVSGDLSIYALGVFLQMVVFLHAIVRPDRFAAELPREGAGALAPEPRPSSVES